MNKATRIALITLYFVAFLPAVHATPAPKDAHVYIITPSTGEVVTSPVIVRFGLVNMGVAPAGIDKANTGHHHLLVDVKSPPAMDKPIPSDKQHLHFGGGQTQTMLELPKGEHTLQLILGDKNHVPHSTPVISEKVTFTVK